MPNKVNDYQYCTKYQIYIYQYKLKYQKNLQENRELISVEYHTLKEKQFCSGVQFVAKKNGIDVDDGWVVTYVHDEETNISRVVKMST